MKNIFFSLIRPKGFITKFLLAVTIICLFSLNHYGYLDNVKALLESDELTIQVGSINLTAYAALTRAIAIVFLICGRIFL